MTQIGHSYFNMVVYNWSTKSVLIGPLSGYGKCQRFIICSRSGMLKAFHGFCSRSGFWQRDQHLAPHTFQSSAIANTSHSSTCFISTSFPLLFSLIRLHIQHLINIIFKITS